MSKDIPGSSSGPKPAKPTTPEVVQSCSRSRVRVSRLLQDRELSGKVISSNKGMGNFSEEFLKTRASNLKVWRFPETDVIGDTALERAHVNFQTAEGEITTSVLLTGGQNRVYVLYSVSEVGKFRPQLPAELRSTPAQAWPILKGDQAQCSSCPESIYRDKAALVIYPSSVSSIKLLGRSSVSGVGGDSNQRALVSTLGSERQYGRLYVLDFKEPIRGTNQIAFNLARRSKRLPSLHCTIWTAECGFNQSRAAVGTDIGTALVDLETGQSLWVLHTQSDVLAQQFVHSGNAVLSGLRNGMIVSVDVREKPVELALTRRTKFVRNEVYSHEDGTLSKSSSQWCKASGGIQTCRYRTLPSSISSLVSLRFDDQYFLASSMDGSVKLYDHRINGRGAVQSYEGHVNSRTRLQLGVDPLERFVMSGGEDSYLRLWNIKSGELVFQEKFSDAVLSTVCWPGVENGPKPIAGVRTKDYETQSCRDYFDTGAWLGSDKGLFYVKKCKPC